MIHLDPVTVIVTALSFAVVLIIVLIIVKVIGAKLALKFKRCRMCGGVKPFALEFEVDGLCRQCLDEILKAQGLKHD